MKFSEKWLREWINPNIPTSELAQQLIMAGHEIGSITPVAKEFSGVVVGEVLEKSAHPNADKLSVCSVNIGEADSLTIVCGAANVRSGLKVPVALIGAMLPGNFKIKHAKLRGVESAGMLCSAVELGLAESSSGLLELPADAPVGEDIREYLSLQDNIIELEITPNRGDCLSLVGVAREVAAINRMPINFPSINSVPGKGSSISVTVQAKEACPVYLGRVIRNLNSNTTTPLWMEERLRRSGIRSINPIVDVTNYVMLALGQPLHAFALQKIDTAIQVRLAAAKEKVVLLDGKTIELDGNTLVIADHSKVLAIAGVMGGLESAVTNDTSEIFLESAYFDATKLHGCARRYGLQTDSSYRFERGVDPSLQLQAMEFATQLLSSIAGGDVEEIVTVKYPELLPKNPQILLRASKVAKLLGTKIQDTEIFEILRSLQMQPEIHEEGWMVHAPVYRFDLAIEEDLLEELARIYGYKFIPEKELVAAIAPKQNMIGINLERISNFMVALGYREVITYGFTSAKMQKLLDPTANALELINPISADLSVMRSTLWGGLLQVAQHNLSRQHSRLRLFETGLCFSKNANEVEQTPYLAGIIFGSVCQEQWGMQVKDADFFDIKNDTSKILQLIDYKGNFIYMDEAHVALHPKRSARIYLESTPIGWLGELHPQLHQELELPRGKAYLFALNLQALTVNNKLSFKEFSKFPRVQRDLAIIVDNEVSWEVIRQKIVDTAGEILHNIQLFDIYCSDSFGMKKKSMAIRLVFQHLAKSLQDEEVDELINKIIFVLKQDVNATLRG